MNKQTCGYDAHYCSGVHFISRYRDENDYCLDGKRVHLNDDGRFSGTTAEFERVQLFELDRYAQYLKEHHIFRKHYGTGDYPVYPFECRLAK